MATYPVSLPTALLASYNNSEYVNYRRDEVQVGPPRYEKITDTTLATFKVAFNFSLFEFQVFEAWFANNLSHGTIPFDIPLPVGMGIVTMECYFDGTYKVARMGKRVSITCVLLSIDKQFNTASDADDLILINGMTNDFDKIAFFSALVQFGEVDLPASWETINYGTDFS